MKRISEPDRQTNQGSLQGSMLPVSLTAINVFEKECARLLRVCFEIAPRLAARQGAGV
jgi:hypothetical protein